MEEEGILRLAPYFAMSLLGMAVSAASTIEIPARNSVLSIDEWNFPRTLSYSGLALPEPQFVIPHDLIPSLARLLFSQDQDFLETSILVTSPIPGFTDYLFWGDAVVENGSGSLAFGSLIFSGSPSSFAVDDLSLSFNVSRSGPVTKTSTHRGDDKKSDDYAIIDYAKYGAPPTYALLGSGVLALGLFRRRVSDTTTRQFAKTFIEYFGNVDV